MRGSRESSGVKPIPLEKNFQKKVLAKLKTLPNTWFYKASDRVKNGIPDIIACVNGRFVAMELKRSKGFPLTPLQRHTLENIRKAEGWGLEVNPQNWDDVFSSLETLASQ